MIPKIIHYCWLSNDPLPKGVLKCIDSWEKNMPDYKIKRWSAENFDISSVRIVKEAVEQKKWAFATDYIRLYALYNEGGIYLDSDVLIHKNLESLFTANFISAIEFNPADIQAYLNNIDENHQRLTNSKSVPGCGIQAAFAASTPKHLFIKECLDKYKALSLKDILDNNLLAPVIQAQCAEKFGFRYINEKQSLKENIVLYSTTTIGQNAYEIKGRFATHCCAGSWEKSSLKHKAINLLNNRFHILPYLYKLKHLFIKNDK